MLTSPVLLLTETFAKATGGKSFTPVEAAKNLLKALKLSPRHVQQHATVAVWNLPATMIAFILLVCIDCLVRKRRGMV